MRKIIYYIDRMKLLCVCIFLFSFISSVLTIIAPVLIGNVIEKIIPIVNKDAVFMIYELIGVYVCLFISNLILNKSLAKIASKISYSIRIDLYKKINSLPIKFLERKQPGEIINNFTVDVDNVSNGLMQALSKIIVGVSTIIIALIIMININIKMSAIMMITAPIMYIVSRYVGTNTGKLFKERAEIISELNGYAEEQISGIRTIKNFRNEAESIKQFKNINDRLKKVGTKAQFFSSVTNPSTRVVTNIAYIVVAIFGIILIKADNQLTLGNLTTFLVYTNVFTRPFNEITAVITEIQAAQASGKRIIKFLNEHDECECDKKIIPKKNEVFKGLIEFKNVTFSYDKKRAVLNNFNLKVEPKEHIAIVGRTGAGKTTIASLLLKFYDIEKGEILIDGVNIEDISLEELRMNIGIVFQDTQLFNGTIKENIAYGMPFASMEKIMEAAKMAGAHEFIERLPQGYDTYVENENILSKGEVQLINIARIMLVKPPIIILDEATSNVDLVTEDKISEAFNKLIKESTSFVIAHKEKTIKNADRIIRI